MSIGEKPKLDIRNYLSEVIRIYETGAATEHSYRAALQKLFSTVAPEVKALNEPKRVQCGAPDFLINRGEIVIGHVEAKDIDKDLTTLKGSEAEQKERYLRALPNLVYTNCLDFEFYREGVLIAEISIADFLMGIQPKPLNFNALENQLRDFVAQKPQTITSSEKLAEIMAGKAALIKDVLFKALKADKDLETEISGQYKAFQEHLIHDITPDDFADIYAETIAYRKPSLFRRKRQQERLDHAAHGGIQKGGAAVIIRGRKTLSAHHQGVGGNRSDYENDHNEARSPLSHIAAKPRGFARRKSSQRRDHGEETLAEIGRSYNVSGRTISRLKV